MTRLLHPGPHPEYVPRLPLSDCQTRVRTWRAKKRDRTLKTQPCPATLLLLSSPSPSQAGVPLPAFAAHQGHLQLNPGTKGEVGVGRPRKLACS